MGCVITLAIVADGRLTIGHVGDTRLYKIRPDEIRKVTRDHSPVGEREDAGELPEPQAMRHPRRHEVFRDVGTALRDKDEQEFVDVIEEPLEPDAAILVCSDGLSDMVPGATIAQIVRQHAGTPERVVEALVTAANDAGGRDNVTVVYGEMPLFAERVRHAAPAVAGAVPAAPDPATPVEPGRVRRGARAILSSRVTWFATGAVAGVIGALALTAYVATTQVRATETLVVAADGSAQFTTIAAALAESRAGDIVRVEPGVYRERLELGDGVELAARVPGTVTVVSPGGAGIPALSVSGTLGVRVTGINISTETQVDVGVRVTAPSATLDLVEITGPIRTAIELAPGSAVTVRGSRIVVAGTILALRDEEHATIQNSILVRSGGPGDPALSIAPAAHLALRGNVFSGFGGEIVAGAAPAQRAELLAGNVVVPIERPAPPAGAARPRGARGGR
jgi:PPM family protein phosphatase